MTKQVQGVSIVTRGTRSSGESFKGFGAAPADQSIKELEESDQQASVDSEDEEIAEGESDEESGSEGGESEPDSEDMESKEESKERPLAFIKDKAKSSRVGRFTTILRAHFDAYSAYHQED